MRLLYTDGISVVMQCIVTAAAKLRVAVLDSNKLLASVVEQAGSSADALMRTIMHVIGQAPWPP